MSVLAIRAGCNVCDAPGPHPEPCDCPCHGSRSVIAWLSSPEGERWSRWIFVPVADQGGIFAEVKPQPWGKPWRPRNPRGMRGRAEHTALGCPR